MSACNAIFDFYIPLQAKGLLEVLVRAEWSITSSQLT